MPTRWPPLPHHKRSQRHDFMEKRPAVKPDFSGVAGRWQQGVDKARQGVDEARQAVDKARQAVAKPPQGVEPPR